MRVVAVDRNPDAPGLTIADVGEEEVLPRIRTAVGVPLPGRLGPAPVEED